VELFSQREIKQKNRDSNTRFILFNKGESNLIGFNYFKPAHHLHSSRFENPIIKFLRIELKKL